MLPTLINSYIIGSIQQQEQLWEDAVTDDQEPTGIPHSPIPLNEKMLHDIQVLVSRLVRKAGQLIGNFTTNLAESWMHVRSKFDGGKVINRSQSGSWEHRCLGAGLRHNLGLEWGPSVYKRMTTKENEIYQTTSEAYAKKASKDKKRKATDIAKENRRKNKYFKPDDSISARKAYSRHSGVQPDEMSEDVNPEYLSELKDGFYKTKVTVTQQETDDIEVHTREQGDSDLWKKERRKRLTASTVGGICKLRKTTKRAKKVQTLLYSLFRGTTATRYGTDNEDVARHKYVQHQLNHSHLNLSVQESGLVISQQDPWLAASPDNRVLDPEAEDPHGLAEYKNPYSARNLTILEAVEKLPNFCLERDETLTFRLKRRHNYFYQVQCQMFCDQKRWCDFVVNTELDIHVERIYFDDKWWGEQMPKLHAFYFDCLLPELASPRHHCGGIREPLTSTQ